MKRLICPYCVEELKKPAPVCLFCARDLPPPDGRFAPDPEETEGPVPPPRWVPSRGLSVEKAFKDRLTWAGFIIGGLYCFGAGVVMAQQGDVCSGLTLILGTPVAALLGAALGTCCRAAWTMAFDWMPDPEQVDKVSPDVLREACKTVDALGREGDEPSPPPTEAIQGDPAETDASSPAITPPRPPS